MRLRTLLRDAFAESGLNVTLLARRTDLGRTTVSNALNNVDQVPSEHTLGVLARALGLDVAVLLELRRDACAPRERVEPDGAAGLGVPIARCDPLDLEVHPAGDGLGRDTGVVLPGYVRRAHDGQLKQVVAQAAAGRSAMAVLVGSSSTGKTRACWEAVQPLAELGWRLWHPFDPTRAEAALAALGRVGPRTVVWLNEAQHYLGAGEQVAAALHALLCDPKRGPVLVLGTLWPEYDRLYSVLPRLGASDPYARARELLAGRRIDVPDAFDAAAVREAGQLAESGDRLLAGVLGREHGGRVAQYLAGVPELLRRYANASPAAKAVLYAAIDARRLGVGLHLPLGFLADAAPGYMNPDAFDALADDWLEEALAQLAEPVHGGLALLRRVRERPRDSPPGPDPVPVTAVGPLYRLADYLEQHGRHERWAHCPPASFWHAAHSRLTGASDLGHLGHAAQQRHRLRWADALYRRAADAGDTYALAQLAEMRRMAGDWDGAERLALRAAEVGDTEALTRLAVMRQEAGDHEGAEALYWRAADAGDTYALTRLAGMRQEAGDREGAEALYWRAADAGDTYALAPLAGMREEVGDRLEAERLALRAAEVGDTEALTRLAGMREEAGDHVGMEALCLRVAEVGDTEALTWLAGMREEAGDHESAAGLYRRAADAGSIEALISLAGMREDAGDRESVEALHRRATDRLTRRFATIGSMRTLAQLIGMRVRSGDWGGVERLVLRAANTDGIHALAMLAEAWEGAGDRDGAERLALCAADAGSTAALIRLAGRREESGDRGGVEALYWRAADAGSTTALVRLAEMRGEVEDWDGAGRLALRAADAGSTAALTWLASVRTKAGAPDTASVLQYGLDPDGTPTPPW